MAGKSLTNALRGLKHVTRTDAPVLDPLSQCLAPRLARSMATEVPMPIDHGNDSRARHNPMSAKWDANSLPAPSVLTTIYSFPSMEPLRFEQYPSTHLHLPLRRDILHRAVVYEGDKTRQGTASTKWRSEIHGSHRKIRPQKGSGRARLGDKTSPMLRGGGVAFGPKPRDFSTELPKKMYDLAWRTALSHRYHKGELIIMDDGVEVEYPQTGFIKQIFESNHWGRADGRSLIITSSFRQNLFHALESAGEDGRVLLEEEVDVKDLLEHGRIVVEKGALDGILRDHQSDLTKSAAKSGRQL